MPPQQHRASIFETTQVDIEDINNPGVQVPATKRLQSITLDAEPQVPTTMVESMGYKAPVDIVEEKEWTKISFKGPLAYDDVLYLLAIGMCVPAIATPTSNGIYTVTLGAASAGTFTLSYNGQTTGAIPYNATAAVVLAALTALSTIGTGSAKVANVSVTGAAGGPYTVTFSGLLQNTQIPLTGNGTSLTGATFSVATTAPTLTKKWSFKPNMTGPDTMNTLSVEKGSTAGGLSFQNACITDMDIDFAQKGVEIKGQMLGTQMVDGITMTTSAGTLVTLGGATGGTFTLTINGQTTGAVAYNATATTLQTALAALSTVGAGKVTVTGAAGGPYKVAFTTIALSQAALTGSGAALTGPAAFSLANIPVVDVPIRAVSPDKMDVFVADTLAGVLNGPVSQLQESFKSMFGFKGRQKAVFTQNSLQPSYSYTVEDKFGLTAQITMEQDAVANGFMADLRAKKNKYGRITTTGGQIEPGMNYKVEVTFPFKFREPKRGDNDGVYAGTYDLNPIYDGAFGGAIQIDVWTDYAAL